KSAARPYGTRVRARDDWPRRQRPEMAALAKSVQINRSRSEERARSERSERVTALLHQGPSDPKLPVGRLQCCARHRLCVPKTQFWHTRVLGLSTSRRSESGLPSSSFFSGLYRTD